VNFHGEKLLKNLQIVEVLRQVAARYNKPVSAVAVRFILDNLPGSVVLSGAKRPEQILANGEALGWKLDEEMLRELEYISR
jgi:aryl-alcohol dehydrogenase-like predicted oxidoreductase